MLSTAIIVPCYNEEKRIKAPEFISFAQQQRDIKFYFVNDGSTDDTQKVLLQIKEASPSEIIALEKNCGKAEAIRIGFIHALENQYSTIGYLDADLSTELEEFLRLKNVLSGKNLDMVFGSRIKKIDTVIERSFFRHIVGRIIATIIDQKFKLGVYDTQCGAKLFRASLIENAVTRPFYTKWFFDVELLLRVKKLNPYFNAAEVPLSKWTNVRNSKLTVLSCPAVFRDLFLLLNKY